MSSLFDSFDLSIKPQVKQTTVAPKQPKTVKNTS